jgi:hypothetical protein
MHPVIRSHRGQNMKIVGHRQSAPLTQQASGAQLIEGAKFNETLACLSPNLGIVKGVYRYPTHEAANQHWLECVAHNMANSNARQNHG